MKKIKNISVLMLLLVFLFSSASCVVLYKKDNGNHNGWFKNPNNPHNPKSTNPGKAKGKSYKKYLNEFAQLVG